MSLHADSSHDEIDISRLLMNEKMATRIRQSIRKRKSRFIHDRKEGSRASGVAGGQAQPAQGAIILNENHRPERVSGLKAPPGTRATEELAVSADGGYRPHDFEVLEEQIHDI